MFTLKEIPDVAVDVPINVPGDNGKSTKATITVRYRLLPISEFKAIFDAPESERLDDDTIMRRDIVDITNIKDDKGQIVPFSSDLLSQLLEMSYVHPALTKGWMDVQTNRAAHAEKN